MTKCEEHNSIVMPIIMCWSAITPYLEGSRLMTRTPPVEPPVEMRAVASVRLSNSFEPRLATAATVSTRLSDSRRFAWRIPCRRASHGDVMSRWLSSLDVVLSSSSRGLRYKVMRTHLESKMIPRVAPIIRNAVCQRPDEGAPALTGDASDAPALYNAQA